MAKKSRSEVKAQATSTLVATLNIADHLTLFKDWLSEGAMYNKDDKGTDSATGTSKTIDYTSYDFIELDANGYNLDITLSNIADGQIVGLTVSDKSAKTVSFTNATIITPNSELLTAETEVTFIIFNKDATNYALALFDTVSPRSAGDITSIKTTILEIGSWNMDSVQLATVAHTATATNILHIQAVIYNDAGTASYFSGHYSYGAQESEFGVQSFTSNLIYLACKTGGSFDSASFSGSSNRGYVIITEKV